MMRAFDPVKVWELIDSERINNGLLVPAMLQFMLLVHDPAKHKHEHVRWLLTGAAPVPVPLIEAYYAIGIEISQVYGLTETCGPACVTSPSDALLKAGSTGKSFLMTDVKVVRPDGTECAERVRRGARARWSHHARLLESARCHGRFVEGRLAAHR